MQSYGFIRRYRPWASTYFLFISGPIFSVSPKRGLESFLRYANFTANRMNISFQPLSEHDFPDFQNDVKDVFSIALIEQFGLPQDKEFFMDDDINETFHNPKLVTYYIYADEKKAGGVALHIDNESHHNRMELFYLYPTIL